MQGRLLTLALTLLLSHPCLAAWRTTQFEVFVGKPHLELNTEGSDDFHEALNPLVPPEVILDIEQFLHELAVLYREQGDYDKAEPLFLEAINGRRLKLGETHPHTQESIRNLTGLYEAWNKPKEAEKWRARLGQSGAVEEGD